MARISNERHSHISVYTHVFFFCLCSCCFFASPSVFGSVFCNPFFPYGVRPTQYLPQPAIKYFSCHKTKSTQRRRKKEEGRRTTGRQRTKETIHTTKGTRQTQSQESGYFIWKKMVEGFMGHMYGNISCIYSFCYSCLSTTVITL